MGTGKKILVIDDDEAAAKLISETLKAQAYQVVISAESQEGIEKARSLEPDLIFINLLLPGSNGLKTSKAIHSIETLQKVPVVMLISYQGELDPRYTISIGIVDVLVKPVKPEEIISKTLKILGESTDEGVAEEASPEAPLEEEIPPFPVDEEPFAIEEKESVLLSEPDELMEPLEAEAVESGEEFGSLPDLTSEVPDHTVDLPDAAEGDSIFSEPPPATQLDESVFDEEDRGLDAIGEELPEREEEIRSSFIPEEEEESGADTHRDIEYELMLEPEKSMSRKILLLVGGLALFAGLIFGASQIRKAFYSDTDKGLDVFLKEKSEHGETEPREVIEEKEVSGEIKTKAFVPSEGTDESKKETAPAEKIDKSDITDRSKKASSALPTGTVKETSTVQKRKFYSLQAGAFHNEKNALSLSDKLKQSGFEAFVKRDITASGKTIHRVLVGKYTEKEKAQEQSQTLLQKEGIESFIYRN